MPASEHRSSIRIARIHHGSAEEVTAYLPNNYRVLGNELGTDALLVVGRDDHGWTLDGYVLPRLGSGMIFGEEITSLFAFEDED